MSTQTGTGLNTRLFVRGEFTEMRWITVQSGAHPFPS